CADDGDICTSDTCDAAANCIHTAVASENCQYKSGKVIVVKPGKLAKFLSKDEFALPGTGDAPTTHGARIEFLDTIFGGAGDVTFSLPATGWKALGEPPSGFKYKGAGTGADPCKVVLIKSKSIEALCAGSAVALTPPFAGDAGIVLEVGDTP